MGYHIQEIPKGKLGEMSKIEEELAELKDAVAQGNKIMALCELSDIYGALSGYLKRYYTNIQMSDLEIMAKATERAFQDGTRK